MLEIVIVEVFLGAGIEPELEEMAVSDGMMELLDRGLVWYMAARVKMYISTASAFVGRP